KSPDALPIPSPMRLTGANRSGCRPQIITRPAQHAQHSGSPRFETVLMMKTAENGFGDDPMTVANPMAGRYRPQVGSIRNAGAKARVWTPAIVMHDPLLKDASQVVLSERNHPVQAFAPNRANHAFAERVGLRRLYRCLQNPQPHRGDCAIDAV